MSIETEKMHKRSKELASDLNDVLNKCMTQFQEEDMPINEGMSIITSALQYCLMKFLIDADSAIGDKENPKAVIEVYRKLSRNAEKFFATFAEHYREIEKQDNGQNSELEKLGLEDFFKMN